MPLHADARRRLAFNAASSAASHNADRSLLVAFRRSPRNALIVEGSRRTRRAEPRSAAHARAHEASRAGLGVVPRPQGHGLVLVNCPPLALFSRGARVAMPEARPRRGAAGLWFTPERACWLHRRRCRLPMPPSRCRLSAVAFRCRLSCPSVIASRRSLCNVPARPMPADVSRCKRGRSRRRGCMVRLSSNSLLSGRLLPPTEDRRALPGPADRHRPPPRPPSLTAVTRLRSRRGTSPPRYIPASRGLRSPTVAGRLASRGGPAALYTGRRGRICT